MRVPACQQEINDSQHQQHESIDKGRRRRRPISVLSNTRYEGGVTNYLEVITAQNAALSDEVTAVNILGRRMASAVQLIEALGGGWDRSSLPQRPECCGKLLSSNSHP
jgi:outer membrane protein TolC